MRSMSASPWSNLRPDDLPLRKRPLSSRGAIPRRPIPGSSAVERSTVNRMVACSNQARGAILPQLGNDEAAGLRATRPLRRGVFVSVDWTTPPVLELRDAASAPEAAWDCASVRQFCRTNDLRRRLSLDRGHQAGVSTCRGRVDAGYALCRETCDIVRSAGLGTRTAQPFATERLALDHRADLVAVDVEVADSRMLLDIVADGIDAALQAKCQPVAGGVDRPDDIRELVCGKANDMKNRAEILAIQLA